MTAFFESTSSYQFICLLFLCYNLTVKLKMNGGFTLQCPSLGMSVNEREGGGRDIDVALLIVVYVSRAPPATAGLIMAQETDTLLVWPSIRTAIRPAATRVGE